MQEIKIEATLVEYLIQLFLSKIFLVNNVRNCNKILDFFFSKCYGYIHINVP